MKTADEIHAFWTALVAVNVVLCKMSRAKAEREAYEEVLELYGEETLLEVFGEELPIPFKHRRGR